MSSRSFIAGNGGTGLHKADDPGAGLRVRVLSALVLAPIALAVVYVGWPFFETLMAAITVVLAWEWQRLCGGALRLVTALLAMAALAMAGAAVGGWPEWSPYVGLLGGLGVYVVARIFRQPRAGWMALGVAYIGLPVTAFLWLRADPDFGRATVLWLALVVMATDSGSFIAGRRLRGPKLVPRLSPNKTWAGVLGGSATAGAVGIAAAWLLGASANFTILAVAVGLGLVAQAGDLVESAAKRHFGVKDTSNLIPGHGGLFDRLDGFLFAGPAAAIVVMAFGADVLSWTSP